MARFLRALGRSTLARALILALALIGSTTATAAAADLTGTAFDDANRDAIMQIGEQPLSGHQLYLFDGAGTYVATKTTDTSGRYAFSGLADGTYDITYAPDAWLAIRHDMAPTTTGSLRPEVRVNVTGTTRVDFGWRAIVRSTTLGVPISSYTGANGLRTESYDDVISAREVYDAVMQGLVGAEAPSVLVRFDWGNSGITSTSVAQTGGVYENYRAISYIAYDQWLTNGDVTLSHEYGHAWSLYYAYMVQQDPSHRAYLTARGLDGDPRVNSTTVWEADELIAEDYRQLLGSATARLSPQHNSEIPPAAQVPGLKDFLQTTYTQPPPSTPPPAPALTVSALSISPTPVKGAATIAFVLSAPASATVRILSASGSLVRTLMAGVSRPAGAVSTQWDRLDAKGRKVSRGTYTVRVDNVPASGASASASRSFAVG